MRIQTLIWLTSENEEKMNIAFNDVYNEYKLLVYYVSFQITNNQMDSEDIVNETFLKLFENRFHLKNKKSVKYFLLETSKNLSLNLKKREERKEPLKEDIVSGQEDNTPYFLKQLGESITKEELDLLIYHLIYGFSFKEMSRLLKKSEDSISSKYSRTIKKLRKKFKGGLNDEI
ncbi:MAG: sigma-70 family RNA polymerase sigma factor [Bacilli bacterium]|nr:sigma-70 family RNA polymerase sigma factor [Bacilli bacterium]